MSDIDEMVAWLRGVLGADERLATSAASPMADRVWRVTAGGSLAQGGYLILQQHHAEVSLGSLALAHIARHDPAHVLNVVAAHRAIIDMYEEARATHGSAAPVRDLAHASKMGKVVALGKALQALAAGYADRDGYRAEWGQR